MDIGWTLGTAGGGAEDGVECHVHTQQLEGVGEKTEMAPGRVSQALQNNGQLTHPIWHQLRIGAGLFLALESALVAANALEGRTKNKGSGGHHCKAAVMVTQG